MLIFNPALAIPDSLLAKEATEDWGVSTWALAISRALLPTRDSSRISSGVSLKMRERGEIL
jgi:hypothetical protein